MEQLIIDIETQEDAQLIKELLKRFKSVEVKSFHSDISSKEINFRIQQGIKDADSGNVKDWNLLKNSISEKLQSYEQK